MKITICYLQLQTVTDEEVSFNYKDYKDGGSQKLMTVSNGEFVRRFAQHILPHRFVRNIVLMVAAGLFACTLCCKACSFPRFQLLLSIP